MKRLIALVALLAVVAACGTDDAGGTATSGAESPEVASSIAGPAPATATAPAATGASEGTGTEETETDTADATVVTVASTDLGEVLVDGEGRTLYAFLNDEQGASTCYDDCAANWPILASPAEAGDGVDAARIGSTERDGGGMQVTYDGWPLYYFAGDGAPGDVNGQGIGDVWYVVDPAGTPVTPDAAAAGVSTRGY